MNNFNYDYNSYLNSMNNRTYIPDMMNNMIDPNIMNYMTNNIQNMNQINNKNGSEILNPTKGYIRGNLFKDLYDPYKNYKPKDISPSNEKEALLEQWRQYSFALTELNLYLDTNPNDDYALNLYNKYLDAKKKTQEKFERMYGPVTLSSNNAATNTWNWINGPWPWEGDK